MVDYFDAPAPSGGAVQADAATANGAAQPFTNGATVDLGMDDISVNPHSRVTRLQ